MRGCLILLCVFLTTLAWPQQSASTAKAADAAQSADSALPNSALKDMFEAKIKAEWEAIKNKDKKAYGELLANDYEGVEVDGQGERSKLQAIGELSNTNVVSYTLWGYKLIPLGTDAAFAIYEVTMQFPPKSVVRFSRVYITELWVKQTGQWKVLHYQETHVK
jgi:hypothetical protein